MNNFLYDIREVCTDIMSKSCPSTTFRRMVNLTKREFRRHNIDIVIKTKLIATLELNEFYINAFYDQESDELNECAIEVIVYHNIKCDVVFEHYQAGQFLVHVYDAVVHELRHKEQAHSRNFINNPHIVDESKISSYLSDPDEIDAYAISIAIELTRNLGIERSLEYLHRASRLAHIRPKGLFASATLFHYFRVFGSQSNPVLKKLVKKVFLNLLELDSRAVFY